MNLRAILISVVVGALTVVILSLYLHRLEVETSGGGPVQVLAALKPLEPGTIITADMVGVKTVPQAYVESRAVRRADAQRIVGLKVESPVKPQQTLMWTDLAVTTDQRRTLSGLVQPGMRAVGIRAADDARFTLVRPGDRVDVFASLPSPKDDRDRIAVLVAQNVLVLAVGTDTGTTDGVVHAAGDRNDQVLTLSVNPQQLQGLTLAMERGRLTVGVRNTDDTRTLERLADLRGNDLFLEQQEKVKTLGPQKPTNVTRPQ